MWIARSTWIVLALIGLLAGGCSSGGSSDSPTAPGNPPVPPEDRGDCPFPAPPGNFPDRTATFTPATAPGPRSINVRTSTLGSCPDLLVLDIMVNSIQDLGGVTFELTWQTDSIGFDNFRVGEHLPGAILTGGGAAGGVSNTTITVPAGAPGVNGSGVLATYAWVYVGPNGPTNMTLSGTAVDSTGAALAGVRFIGGTLSISE